MMMMKLPLVVIATLLFVSNTKATPHTLQTEEVKTTINVACMYIDLLLS